jgi:hypothetical protein
MRIIFGNRLYAYVAFVLLCCASTAMGQSVAAEVSAGLSGGGPDDSSVSAAVSSITAASIATGGGGAGAHSFALENSSLPSAGAHSFALGNSGLPSAGASTQQKSVLKSRRLSGASAYLTPHASKVSAAEAGRTNAHQTTTANPDNIRSIGAQANVQSSASYSTDFPDSTEGTAMISPPDPGTTSPLDWTITLNFSFEDFSQREFLNPSLQVGGSRARRRRNQGSNKNAINANTSNGQTSGLYPSGLQPASPQTSLEPGILNQPILQSPLGQQ